jgi:hypothetical protein
VHRRNALGLLGEFAPLPGDVQIHLLKCGVRSRHGEPLAFHHLFPAPFCPFAHFLITNELLEAFLNERRIDSVGTDVNSSYIDKDRIGAPNFHSDELKSATLRRSGGDSGGELAR